MTVLSVTYIITDACYFDTRVQKIMRFMSIFLSLPSVVVAMRGWSVKPLLKWCKAWAGSEGMVAENEA